VSRVARTENHLAFVLAAVDRVINKTIAKMKLFLTRDVGDYASAVLAMALCLSVRLSVCCPSQVGVLLKRLNAGSNKQHHTIAQGV